MKQEQADNSFPTMKAAGTVMIFLTRIFSLPVTVRQHEGYGSRFLGWTGGFALLPFFLVAMLCGTNCVALTSLMWIYIFRCIAGKAWNTYQLIQKRLPTMHSRYAGKPIIARLLPTWSEDALLWLEPLGVFVLGQIIFWFNRPLGYYLCWAAIGAAGWRCLTKVYAMNKLLDSNDAVVEQRVHAEKLRDLQGQ
jgi:hypothetical protein